MAPKIEELSDLKGFLKFSSLLAWICIAFPYFDLRRVVEPFVAIRGTHASGRGQARFLSQDRCSATRFSQSLSA
jgi:hypothetical protein